VNCQAEILGLSTIDKDLTADALEILQRSYYKAADSILMIIGTLSSNDRF